MALSFSSNDIIKASALVSAAPMTFCAWVNMQSIAADAYIMAITSSTSGHSSVFAMKFLTASQKMCCYISNDAASTTDNTAAATVTIGTSTWYHVACVFTSTTSRTCYVNGANSVSSSVSVSPSTCDTTTIGAAKFNALYSYATCYVAFPAIWNIALSSTDIAGLALAEGPLHNNPASLQSYSRLIGDNPASDLKGFSWTLET